MLSYEEITNNRRVEYNKNRFISLKTILSNINEDEVLNTIQNKISEETTKEMLFDTFVEGLAENEKSKLLNLVDDIFNDKTFQIDRDLQNQFTLLDIMWVLREQHNVPNGE
ncbi:hypothetical protein [Bacillus sp. CGMCC 1.16541]|uniref:hypothetical protein n=1 Tax=Bacillus sp. CGMCC 1.16541 TaxID=2185143 RepID=UPI000D73BB8F|nr:hypothetical protein [Bacillus sp. CGMCC 1.16541]